MALALGLPAAPHRQLFRCGLVRRNADGARDRYALVSLLRAAYGAVTNLCPHVLSPVLVNGTLHLALRGTPRWMGTWNQMAAAVWAAGARLVWHGAPPRLHHVRGDLRVGHATAPPHRCRTNPSALPLHPVRDRRPAMR